jgi:hypothetical protein
LSILALGARCAEGYTTLSLKTRRQIVHRADLQAPNHKGMIRRAACIEGRLSTVDRRWAMFVLTNTKVCVRRYGGASGGAGLLERTSTTSVDWEQVGEIGEQGCFHGEGGASDTVLGDLGCASFASEAGASHRSPAGSTCGLPPLPVGVLWVNDIGHPKFSFLFVESDLSDYTSRLRRARRSAALRSAAAVKPRRTKPATPACSEKKSVP